ncbi:hypothetical protein K2P97_07085 [bacterium]|nr:hypothetical protein [bacterium]
MKTIFTLTTMMLLSFSLFAQNAQIQEASTGGACYSQPMGGVDVWPWSVAQPFPWDNIQGFWKLGDDESSYLKATVLSSTNRRKILSLSVYGEGVCSKPYARGTGYIDASEKNVVRALVADGTYKYQLKLGMFDSRDISGLINSCSENIMGVSMQVIGRARKSDNPKQMPLDPSVTETHNMLLKKVTIDLGEACKKIN